MTRDLLVWFRNGKLYRAGAYSRRSITRAANSWNEYGKLWSRVGETHLIAIVAAEDILRIAKKHEGVPTRNPAANARRKKIKNLMLRNAVGKIN